MKLRRPPKPLRLKTEQERAPVGRCWNCNKPLSIERQKTDGKCKLYYWCDRCGALTETGYERERDEVEE